MPRETISSEGPFAVKVGFPKGGMVRNDTPGVQVGVEGDEQITSGGKPEVRFVSAWAHLDRQGCNDLIRVLRRARDGAFGRDE